MRVYPVMLALVPFAVWVLSVASGSGLLDRAGKVVGADFVAFYMAGVFARQGRLRELGDLVAQSEFQRQLVAPLTADGFVLWINPPFFAAAFAPLGGCSYRVALAVFWILGGATFVATVLVVRRLLCLPASRARLLLLAGSYFPTIAWFTFGQTSAFSLALMTASVAGLLLEHDLIAGLALGCLAYKPQLAIGLGLALIFARRWRAVSGAIVSGAGSFVVSYVVAPEATRDWVLGSPALLSFIRESRYPMWGLASLYGGSALLLDGLSRSLAGVVGAALTGLALACLFRLWRAVPWRPSHTSFRLALAATLAVALLVSPHLYFYDLMLMLLPAALVVGVLSSEIASHRARLANAPIVAATAWVYFLGLPSPYLALAQQEVSRRITGHPFALQLETVAIAVWAWRVGRRAVVDVGALVGVDPRWIGATRNPEEPLYEAHRQSVPVSATPASPTTGHVPLACIISSSIPHPASSSSPDIAVSEQLDGSGSFALWQHTARALHAGAPTLEVQAATDDAAPTNRPRVTVRRFELMKRTMPQNRLMQSRSGLAQRVRKLSG